MMKEVIKDADEAGITLFLSVDPDGTGLTKIQLQRWYFRLGFERFPGTDMQGAVQKTKEVKQCQEERSFTGDGSSPYLIPQIKGVQICI